MKIRIEHRRTFISEYIQMEPGGPDVAYVAGHEIWAWYRLPISAPKSDVEIRAIKTLGDGVAVSIFAHDCVMRSPDGEVTEARFWARDLREGSLLRVERLGPGARLSFGPAWLMDARLPSGEALSIPQSNLGNYGVIAEPDRRRKFDVILHMNLGPIIPATFDGIVLGVKCMEPRPEDEYEAADTQPPDLSWLRKLGLRRRR